MDFVKVVKNIIYQDKINNAGKLDLYLPENKKCIALLIFFHGGGLEEGDKEDNREIYEVLASGGIAVAWVLTHIKEWIVIFLMQDNPLSTIIFYGNEA